MNAQSQAANISENNRREAASRRNTPDRGGEKKQHQLILVVDDKPFHQFYTSIFLQRLNYQVLMAKTAEDALAFLSLSVPLAIIADIDLPQINGIDLLKSVKRDRRTRDIPFIIYTSSKDPRKELSSRKAGAAAYLTHSAPLDELYLALQKATETKPRRFFRLATSLNVTIGAGLPAAGEAERSFILAISEKGMFVSTSAPFADGSVHPFTFALPNAQNCALKIEGQVIYSRYSSDKKRLSGIGVRFLKIESKEQELIEDFIRGTLMEGLSVG